MHQKKQKELIEYLHFQRHIYLVMSLFYSNALLIFARVHAKVFQILLSCLFVQPHKAVPAGKSCATLMFTVNLHHFKCMEHYAADT